MGSTQGRRSVGGSTCETSQIKTPAAKAAFMCWCSVSAGLKSSFPLLKQRAPTCRSFLLRRGYGGQENSDTLGGFMRCADFSADNSEARSRSQVRAHWWPSRSHLDDNDDFDSRRCALALRQTDQSLYVYPKTCASQRRCRSSIPYSGRPVAPRS